MTHSFNHRQALQSAACGFGGLALAGLLGQSAKGAVANPLAAKLPHFAPKAKRVIFLFMQGGVSQVDSFDYKPLLEKEDGKMMNFDDARVIANTGKKGSSQRVMKSLWKYGQHGESGKWTSELFPEMAKHVDDMCFLHSVHTEGIAHGPATLFLHCGSTNFIRPSMGSWITYGLGTENDNLPGFVSISPSAGNGGPRNYGNAFLPPVFQGTGLGKAGGSASEATIRNLANPALGAGEQRRHFELLQSLNAEQLRKNAGDSELEAVINSYELAWRMQNNAPSVLDVSSESANTQAPVRHW